MSVTFKHFSFLFSDNMRSRAYAQFLFQSGVFPLQLICLGTELVKPPSRIRSSYIDTISGFKFKPNESVEETFQSKRAVNNRCKNLDINSEAFEKNISEMGLGDVVYSGKGGVLLSSDVLDKLGNVLHIHGGYLPDYRGSTTFYYSLLNEGYIGATGMLINSEIDQGDIVYRQKFYPEKGVDIDYVFDPLVRANVLVKSLKRLMDSNVPEKVIRQPQDSGVTYQVIHPVLKRLALDKIETS